MSYHKLCSEIPRKTTMTFAGIFGVLTEVRNALVTKAVRFLGEPENC